MVREYITNPTNTETATYLTGPRGPEYRKSEAGATVSKVWYAYDGLGSVLGETGLITMRARYMDPAVGMFISEDPAVNGNNWFVYCNNDPINFSDYSGKACESVLVQQGLLVHMYLPEGARILKRDQLVARDEASSECIDSV